VATTNRVAGFIGAGKIKHASIAARTASWVAVGNGFMVMAILFLFRERIAFFFTVSNLLGPIYQQIYRRKYLSNSRKIQMSSLSQSPYFHVLLHFRFPIVCNL
jgi:hypothetical protein